jgi:hypothetical protein
MDRFIYEREAKARGFTRIAGVDEVGRAAWAGPLVAAAVVLSEDFGQDGIRSCCPAKDKGGDGCSCFKEQGPHGPDVVLGSGQLCSGQVIREEAQAIERVGIRSLHEYSLVEDLRSWFWPVSITFAERPNSVNRLTKASEDLLNGKFLFRVHVSKGDPCCFLGRDSRPESWSGLCLRPAQHPLEA